MKEDNKLPTTLEELPIKFFKLMSGESIISYTHDVDNEYCIGLEEPMSVKVSAEEYVLTPWIPFSDGRVHILEAMNVIIEAPVDSNMKAQYMRIVLDSIIEDNIKPESKVLH